MVVAINFDVLQSREGEMRAEVEDEDERKVGSSVLLLRSQLSNSHTPA